MVAVNNRPYWKRSAATADILRILAYDGRQLRRGMLGGYYFTTTGKHPIVQGANRRSVDAMVAKGWLVVSDRRIPGTHWDRRVRLTKEGRIEAYRRAALDG